MKMKGVNWKKWLQRITGEYWKGEPAAASPPSFNRRAWGFYTRSRGNEIQEVILEMSTNKTRQGVALKLGCGRVYSSKTLKTKQKNNLRLYLNFPFLFSFCKRLNGALLKYGSLNLEVIFVLHINFKAFACFVVFHVVCFQR